MVRDVPAQKSKSPPKPNQAIAAKIFHWINLISLILMIGSGLQIYNANPVFGGRGGWHFPSIFLLGGWLAGGRHWHFAAMWLFALNLLGYGIYIFISRRWKHRFVSSNDLKALQKSQNVKRKTYAWHRLAFTAIIPVLLLAILTGLGMYKPAQLHWIVDLFGSWQALRVVHFISVPVFITFAVIHSLLGLKVGGSRLIKSIFF
ncbi:cytochrome b/b6 domain-containing protein [Argonema antarcticum]|uniref:cytochrome b/b6 domain-containing protein n=1 Tax=Argonema antarcticum TaxID=2942763 RepID=UPI0020114DAE|nr:cytochrome b/b6 domain-containing protein [Argonema antarcticum]MCL1469912.1 cytochrome b/b6 domain-containing protein [Argonema antarcticum A004/B2]